MNRVLIYSSWCDVINYEIIKPMVMNYFNYDDSKQILDDLGIKYEFVSVEYNQKEKNKELSRSVRVYLEFENADDAVYYRLLINYVEATEQMENNKIPQI